MCGRATHPAHRITRAEILTSRDDHREQAISPVAPPGKRNWTSDWEDGHYVIVIGADEPFVYVEDPSLLGSRGVIPKQEFLDRWHDYTGAAPFDPSDRAYVRLGIFISGKTPARYFSFTKVD